MIFNFSSLSSSSLGDQADRNLLLTYTYLYCRHQTYGCAL